MDKWIDDLSSRVKTAHSKAPVRNEEISHKLLENICKIYLRKELSYRIYKNSYSSPKNAEKLRLHWKQLYTTGASTDTRKWRCSTLLGRKQIGTPTLEEGKMTVTSYLASGDQGLEDGAERNTPRLVGPHCPDASESVSGFGGNGSPLSELLLPHVCMGLATLMNTVSGVTSLVPWKFPEACGFSTMILSFTCWNNLHHPQSSLSIPVEWSVMAMIMPESLSLSFIHCTNRASYIPEGRSMLASWLISFPWKALESRSCHSTLLSSHLSSYSVNQIIQARPKAPSLSPLLRKPIKCCPVRPPHSPPSSSPPGGLSGNVWSPFLGQATCVAKPRVMSCSPGKGGGYGGWGQVTVRMGNKSPWPGRRHFLICPLPAQFWGKPEDLLSLSWVFSSSSFQFCTSTFGV